MKQIALSLILALASLSFAGCLNNDEPGEPETAAASIVTYESTAQNTSTFSYTDGDGRLITLTASWEGNSGLKPGARALIYYRAETYGESGPIALLSVTPLPGGSPKAVPAGGIPASEPLKEARAWLSGNFLNFGAVITFSGDASEVSLYNLGEDTDGSARVQVVIRPESSANPVAAERQLYASWNVGALLNDVTTLTVTYTDGNKQLQNIELKPINITNN